MTHIHNLFSRLKQLLLAFSILFLFLLIGAAKTEAFTQAPPIYSNSPPTGYQLCPDQGTCTTPDTCWNSERVGVTDCGAACSGGNPWSKYTMECVLDPVNPDVCRPYYTRIADVCSTADKCTTTINNPFLNAGRCDCTVLGIYKTCCSNTTPSYVINDSRSGMSDDSCVQLAVDTTNPPWEGVCPAGSQAFFCGFGNYPACGQSACGDITPPPSTCPAGVEPGGACGSCITQTCSNGTACASGHEYCIYDPIDGNYCSSCVTEVNTCSSSCTSTTTRTCSVSSWTFSPSATPQTNSTVNVSVDGTATPGWNGASYSLDGGGWTSVPSGPPFSFNVNSGSAGLHTLRFAISNGSTVCSGTGSFTF